MKSPRSIFKILFVASVMAVSAAPAMTIAAQDTATAQTDDAGKRQKWLKDMRQYKHEFLIKQLNLTREQRDKFFALYDKMEDEINSLNSETREMERRIYDNPDGQVTDLEYELATKALVDLKGKECEIERGYYEQMADVVSKKQLFELKKAERDFSMQMMKHSRRSRK